MKSFDKKAIIDDTVIPFLRDYLGYDPSLMKKNVSVKSPSDKKNRTLDLVFYIISNDQKSPYLLVEVVKSGISFDSIRFQIESISQDFHTPYFLITNGDDWQWYENDFDEKKSFALDAEIHYYKITGADKLNPIQNINVAQTIINQCHDVIWNEKSSTPEDALKELSKFLIAKIIDEREVDAHKKELYEFKIKDEREDAIDIKNRINFLLLKAKKLDSEMFVDKKPELNLKPYSIIKIVQKLQNFSLLQTKDVEILGETYQGLLKKVYTDRVKGQRFTPRTIVDLMVDLIDPKLNETVYDPACGTGGFLVSILKHIKNNLKYNSKTNTKINPNSKLQEYTTNNLFGTDIEPTVIQLAKANMLIHGDGHTHVLVQDALEFGTKDRLSEITAGFGGFDIILTNPPFGGIKIDPDILNKYSLAQNTTGEITQVLFIERCLNLLKPGGRLGIVLPEGILNNIKQKNVREYILEKSVIKSVISLPIITFKPYGAAPKTSILFLQKKKHSSEKQGKIIMAQIVNIGYNATGDKESVEDISAVKKEISKIGGIPWNK